jgi:hypothetical protein
MNAILQAVEQHKDLANLTLSAAGMVLTLAGAGWVAWKYIAEKRETRLKTELDLRRQAYFDLFDAIPPQLAALGNFAGTDAASIVLVEAACKALLRLHLVASHEALECMITRNAIYHEEVIQLTSLKRTARQLNAVVDGGPTQFLRSMGLHGSSKAFRPFRKQSLR